MKKMPITFPTTAEKKEIIPNSGMEKKIIIYYLKLRGNIQCEFLPKHSCKAIFLKIPSD